MSARRGWKGLAAVAVAAVALSVAPAAIASADVVLGAKGFEPNGKGWGSSDRRKSSTAATPAA